MFFSLLTLEFNFKYLYLLYNGFEFDWLGEEVGDGSGSLIFFIFFNKYHLKLLFNWKYLTIIKFSGVISKSSILLLINIFLLLLVLLVLKALVFFL